MITAKDRNTQQTDFYHLLELTEKVRPRDTRTKRVQDAAKSAEATRLRRHPLANTVPSRTLAHRRQLIGAMELLKNAGEEGDCNVEVLTLGDQVLWDYERYEIALQLGLAIRPIPFRGSDPTVRLCLDVMHAPQFNSGIRAIIAVIACKWAGSGRPRNSTLGVRFRDTSWTIKEMSDLARVGTTRISAAKEICAFGLEDRVLAREFSFGEAVKRIKSVRAAGLEKRVLQRELTFDEAHKQAGSREKAGGPDDDRNHSDGKD